MRGFVHHMNRALCDMAQNEIHTPREDQNLLQHIKVCVPQTYAMDQYNLMT